MKWVYHRGVREFSAMTDLSKTLRDRLTASASLDVAGGRHRARIGGRHAQMGAARSPTATAVEAVLIPDRGRNTLCVSTQVGCMLDCSFCSTGKQGFNGNLSAAEIVGQVFLVICGVARDGR